MGNQRPTVAVVCSKKGLRCHDTVIVLALLTLFYRGIFELVKQDSERAKELWAAAAAAKLIQGDSTGHPLVCVLNEEEGKLNLLAALVEPDEHALRGMLFEHNCEVDMTDDLVQDTVLINLAPIAA